MPACLHGQATEPLNAQEDKAVAPASPGKFRNPLLPAGPDPWVIYQDGFYYQMNSADMRLVIRKTRDITDLRHAEKKVVWTPPAVGPYSHDIWAPELHRWDGKWYIYFAADAGQNETHRIWCIENSAADPTTGTWTMKGKVTDPTDKWAIDASVFEDRGRRYMIWSGWKGDTDGEQDIFIARLKNPWTVESERTLISQPNHVWEEVGDILDRPAIPHVNVNEGPEILKHGDDIFLVFSAAGCWTDYYSLGALRAKSGADLLKTASWTKFDQPLLKQDRAAGVFGPGHNGFFKSPDGKEDWIIYHANPKSGQGCEDHRSPRIQRFSWNADGSPNFGTPLPTTTEIAKPSGTPQ